MLLQDGSVMAEVSVLPLGVVGRCAAKTKNEVRTIFKGSRSNCLMIVFFLHQAAEQAAAVALHNPMIMQPMVAPPPTVPHHGSMVFVP